MQAPNHQDLGRILGNQANTMVQISPNNQLVQAPVKKKQTQTTLAKRANAMLNILRNKDRFGIEFAKLCLALDVPAIKELANAVKQTYGII